MAVEFGFEIYVTKGELATIMGTLAFGDAITDLQVPGMTMGGGLVKGQSVLNVLGGNFGTNGIWLDNPEVLQIFDLLAYEQIITPAVRQRITDYVAAQIGTTPGAAAETRHRWRLPGGIDPSDWFTGVDLEVEPSIDGYVRVWTTAAVCAHPAAVMEV